MTISLANFKSYISLLEGIFEVSNVSIAIPERVNVYGTIAEHLLDFNPEKGHVTFVLSFEYLLHMYNIDTCTHTHTYIYIYMIKYVHIIYM